MLIFLLQELRLNSTLQPFPISNRNSPAAIDHLLKVTHCKHLIYTSTNEQLRNLAENASKNASEVQLTSMPELSALYNESEPPKIAALSARRKDLNAPALIIHSSGSTSYPKAIVQSNKNVMHWGRVPLYGGSDVCEKVIFSGCLPTFHAVCDLLMTTFSNISIDGMYLSDSYSINYWSYSWLL